MGSGAATRTVRSAVVATGTVLLCAGGLRLCWMAAAGPLEAIQASGPDAPDDLIIVGAAALGAVLLGWLGLGALLAALAAVPGAVGRLADAAADRVAPAVVRRATAVLLGTALATAPIPVAHAAAPQPVPSAETTTGQAVGPLAPDPGFGVTTRQPSNSPPTAPVLGPLGPGPHTPSSTASRTVTVMRGDTLWAIAARHLGPQASPLQVAREWPRWYAANRTVIGSNPNLIRVGQVLTVPNPGASS